MRRCIFAGALLMVAAYWLPVCAQSGQPKLAVTGTVLEAGTRNPIFNALVKVTAVEPDKPRGQAVVKAEARTDVAGRFRVEVGEPGLYTISAEADGYRVTPPYDSTPAYTRVSADGKSTLVTTTLYRPASIEGQVVDAQRQHPVRNAAVRLRQITVHRGRLEVGEDSRQADTQQDGTFRVENVTPGKYLVEVINTSLHEQIVASRLPDYTKANPRPNGYAAHMLWPSEGLFFGATIDVFSGQHVYVGKIELKREPLLRIRGSASAVGCGAGDILTLNLDQLDPPPDTMRARIKAPCGSPFTAVNLQRGRYSLSAWLSAGQPSDIRYGRLEIALSDKDVDDIVIPLGPPYKVDGELSLPERYPDSQRAKLRARMISTSGNVFFVGENQPIEIRSDGRFTLYVRNGISPKLTIEGVSLPWMVKDILYNGSSLQGGRLSIDVHAMSHSIRVILSDRAAILEGTLLDGDQVPPRPWGVMLPWPLQIEDGFPVFRSLQFDEKGRFRVTGLAAGSYRVIGFDSSMTSEWFHTPGVLAHLASRAQEVILREGGTSSIRLEFMRR